MLLESLKKTLKWWADRLRNVNPRADTLSLAHNPAPRVVTLQSKKCVMSKSKERVMALSCRKKKSQQQNWRKWKDKGWLSLPRVQPNDGRPSSWSAAIDELTSGYIDEIYKLFIVSAGNNEINNRDEYPDSNYTSVVENPGQSWNALTIGAYTELHEPYKAYTPLAPKGGLSPYSTTSYTWDKNKWPIKLEIVLEGGNKVVDNFGAWSDVKHSVLTTSHEPLREQFTTFNASSAATAKIF